MVDTNNLIFNPSNTDQISEKPFRVSILGRIFDWFITALKVNVKGLYLAYYVTASRN